MQGQNSTKERLKRALCASDIECLKITLFLVYHFEKIRNLKSQKMVNGMQRTMLWLNG